MSGKTGTDKLSSLGIMIHQLARSSHKPYTSVNLRSYSHFSYNLTNSKSDCNSHFLIPFKAINITKCFMIWTSQHSPTLSSTMVNPGAVGRVSCTIGLDSLCGSRFCISHTIRRDLCGNLQGHLSRHISWSGKGGLLVQCLLMIFEYIFVYLYEELLLALSRF